MSGAIFPFLAKLKRPQRSQDPSSYLQNEMRQNLKAIEDALKKLGTNLTSVENTIATPVNYVVSPAQNTFNTTSVSKVDVTNLTLEITTTGNPVVLLLIPKDAPAIGSNIVQCFSSNTADNSVVSCVRDALNLGDISINRHRQYIWLDVASAGTYIYKIQANSPGGGTTSISYMRLMALEL